MRKKKGRRTTTLLVIVFLVGLSVMLYPTVANLWNKHLQGEAIADYQQKVNQITEDRSAKLIAQAREYNKKLLHIAAPLKNYDKAEGYYELLDVSGTGVMGIINIPAIGVELPIYHGTSEGVLNVAVGHLQGSSLPVGGKGTHAVISAHRGLPSAMLFTDLDKLVEGDEFTITVLKEVYTYEVDKISIVLPYEYDELLIDPEKDYVTLMTCTPYGINTHRLLVRAHRTGTKEADAEQPELKVSPDAVLLDSMTVVPFIAAIPAAALLGWWLFGGKKKKFPHDDPLSVLEDRQDRGQ
ncbi:MAG: class C sortase [Ruminococcus sp.]|nr:class C sortase [Ruminococcus sp.]